MEGWIKIHHKFLNWEWFKEDGTLRLFVDILLRANFIDKSWKGIVVKRGQYVTTISQLSSEIGLSVRTVRTCLSRLEQTGEIFVKTTNKFSVITISNYDTYQDEKIENDKQTTNKRQTNDKQNKSVNVSILNDCDRKLFVNDKQTTNKRQTKTPKLNKQNDKQNNVVNGSISNDYDEKLFCDDKQNNNQITNNVTNKAEESSPLNPFKEEIQKKKETSNFIKLEEKKVELSFANAKKLLKIRSDKFYESLIPFVSIYGKEMVRAFFDYWSEPNRSQTKMKFELERTWDLKRRLNTWSSRDKTRNIQSNGTEYKQQQQQQRAREIEELNNKLNESGF